MTFLIEQWNRRFSRAPQALQQPEAAVESLLQAEEPALDDEALVPDPEWDDSAQRRDRHWQRPVLFVIAALLVLVAGGYTLTNDWWLARQHKNLDRQIGRTAVTVQAEAVETKAQLQDGFEQLLSQGEASKPALALPPVPPAPQAKFAQIPPPEVIRRLPPLPSFNAPIRSLPQPVAAVPVSPPQPKVTLVGGNDQVVLLDVGGERVQLLPGQTGAHNITVLSTRNEPGHYRVQLRLGNGTPLLLNLATAAAPSADSAEAAQVEPPPAAPAKNEQITPLT